MQEDKLDHYYLEELQPEVLCKFNIIFICFTPILINLSFLLYLIMNKLQQMNSLN